MGKIGKLAIIIFIMVFSLLLVQTAPAKSSELFIDYLTNLIYEDCRGKDINVKYILLNNQTFPVLKWPYEKTALKNIIKIYGDLEPFKKYFGTCEDYAGTVDIGPDGCGILTCQNNRLDISEYEYFWNGVRVDVPREGFKATFGPNSPIVETHGERSPVTTGDNSSITQQEENIWLQLFWSKGTIGGLFIALIGFVVKNGWQFLVNKRQKFIEEYHIKAELGRIKKNLEVGGTPKPIEFVLGADHIKKYRLFGENFTQVILLYKGFDDYNNKFEDLKNKGDLLGIQRNQVSKANEMRGILSNHWMKKIPDDYSDLSTIKFIRYLLGRDAKEEPTKKSRCQFWK